ncbi:hypothetical protein AC578_4797 [Pseudocercospora eumusae]|uniref:Uncharacterized protein n=1 Tax=Pseudocercospora eumusae TaxID=321146 RepID=A0A139HL77_9PEZI|nr:hypothetical protein AC578_4797 [Pseudocercospora eumusae]
MSSNDSAVESWYQRSQTTNEPSAKRARLEMASPNTTSTILSRRRFQSPQRSIHIALDYLPWLLESKGQLHKDLHRWIIRASSSAKNGAGTDFRYYRDINRRKSVLLALGETAAILFFMMKYEKASAWHPRSMEEAHKISEAVHEAPLQAYEVWLEPKPRNDEQDARIKASVQAEVLRQ